MFAGHSDGSQVPGNFARLRTFSVTAWIRQWSITTSFETFIEVVENYYYSVHTRESAGKNCFISSLSRRRLPLVPPSNSEKDKK